jgi:SET domain-containing protein
MLPADKQVVVKAARTIKKGEEITIAYNKDCLHSSKSLRKEILVECFGKYQHPSVPDSDNLCWCSRCKDPER